MIAWLKAIVAAGKWCRPWTWLASRLPADLAAWEPKPAPPWKMERLDEILDHVFDWHTGYWIAARSAGAFDDHPHGEGNPDLFLILRSGRQLPDQYDRDGARCRQLDLDALELLAEKCYDQEGRLANVFNLDQLSDEDFVALWLEGRPEDFDFWSREAVKGAAGLCGERPDMLGGAE